MKLSEQQVLAIRADRNNGATELSKLHGVSRKRIRQIRRTPRRTGSEVERRDGIDNFGVGLVKLRGISTRERGGPIRRRLMSPEELRAYRVSSGEIAARRRAS